MAQIAIVAVIAIAAALALRFLVPQPSGRKQDPRDIKISDSAFGNFLTFGKGRFVAVAELVQSREVRVKKKKVKQGKGGGGGSSGVEYTYFLTAAFAVADTFYDGPIAGVYRVWTDKKLIYDATGRSTLDTDETVTIRFALGSDDQDPDQMTIDDFGADLAPGYVNTVMIYFDDFPLSIVNNHIPNVEAELDTETAPSGAGTISQQEGNPETFNVFFEETIFDLDRDFIYAQYDSGSIGDPSLSLDKYNRTTLNRVSVLDLDLGSMGGMAFCGIDQETGYLIGSHFEIGVNEWSYVYDPATETLITQLVNSSGHGTFDDGNAVLNLEGAPCWTLDPTTGTKYVLSSSILAVRANVFTSLALHDEFYGPNVGDPPASWTWFFGHLCPGPTRDTVVGIWGEDNAEGGVDRFKIFKYVNASGVLSETEIGTILPTDVHADLIRFELVEGPNMMYHSTDGSYVFWVNGLESVGPSVRREFAVKWKEGSGILWSTEITNDTEDTSGITRHYTQLGGDFWFWGQTFTNDFFAIDLSTGEKTDYLDTSYYVELNAGAWDSVEGCLYQWKVTSPAGQQALEKLCLSAGSVSDSSVPLADVLRMIFDASGLVEGTDYDVSDVDQNVWGFVVDSETTWGALVEDILPMYFLILLEESGKIIVKKREGAVVATIPVSKFVVASDTSDDEDSDPYTIELTDESELPIETNVAYVNPRQQYESGAASWRRPIAPEKAVENRTVLDIKTPLVLTPEDPTDAAYVWTYLPWVERSRITFKLHWEYLWLSPGDPIDIDFENGTVLRARVQSCPIGQDWTMEVTAVFETTGSIEAASQSTTSGDIRIDTVSPLEDTVLHFVDILLRDEDDQGGTAAIGYFLGSPQESEDGWPGYTLYRSDDGANFDSLESQAVGAPYGTTAEALGDPADVNATDLDNTLLVTVAYGIDDIESITRAQLYAGANGAIIYKSGGEYEIIQYQTVESVSATQVRLSVLSRGKRGTDTMATGHSSGEKIVFLDPEAIGRLPVSLSKIGVSRTYRGVTGSQPVEDAADVLYTFDGDSLRPYAPVQQAAVADTPSTGDVTFSWVRRSRVGAAVVNGVWRHPLDGTEAYEVDILSGAAGSIVRTLSATTNSVVYLSADRVTDGFDPMPSSFHIRVYQMSEVIGRGFAYEVEVFV